MNFFFFKLKGLPLKNTAHMASASSTCSLGKFFYQYVLIIHLALLIYVSLIIYVYIYLFYQSFPPSICTWDDFIFLGFFGISSSKFPVSLANTIPSVYEGFLAVSISSFTSLLLLASAAFTCFINCSILGSVNQVLFALALLSASLISIFCFKRTFVFIFF